MPRHASILLAGAAIYALIVGALDVTFDATPLIVGLIALAAATVGGARQLTATGLALAGWGAAVLLVRHGPLPGGREAAAFLVGGAAGLLAARLLGRARPGQKLGDGSAALVVGGLAFYLAFDLEWVYDWPLWTVVLLAWAAWEAKGRRTYRKRRR